MDGRIYLFIPVLLFTLAFSYWTGVFVGSRGIAEIQIRLESHALQEVHRGALRRDVYEAEARQLRERIVALEEWRARGHPQP